MISDVFLSNLNRYIDGVADGTIIASKSVQSAVRRHLQDVRRQSTTEFPYHFDVAHAAKVCRFYPEKIRHSIGRYRGMPFELEHWQMFCTASIFGWLRDADETRRFRKVYRSMARKNGKSTWAAAEAIFMAGFDRNPKTKSVEPVSQVVLAATKRDQVDKIIFAEALRMRTASPALEAKSVHVRSKKEIKFPANSGEILTTAVDKPLDGLNPHCVVLDELHAWAEHNRPFFDTMMTGSGARDQPLICFITTAGDDRSQLWLEEYTYAKSVAASEVNDDRYFSFIAELDEEDDPFDPENWKKGNPNLGVSITEEYLREQAVEHKTSAIKTNTYTRYQQNRKTTSISTAFDMQEWDACSGDLSDWRNADCVTSGFDLGGYDDLSAIGFCARFLVDGIADKPVYRYEVKTHAFISEKTTRDLAKQPFFDWIHRDLIKKSPHPTSDLRQVLLEDAQHYGIKKIAFDPSNARSLAEELTQAGLIAASMGQNCPNFNEPIHDLMAAIREGRFKHDGNPLLRWCVSNAVLIRDRQDRWMYDKRDSNDKIDPVVAMTMAFRLATLEPARATGSMFLV